MGLIDVPRGVGWSVDCAAKIDVSAMLPSESGAVPANDKGVPRNVCLFLSMFCCDCAAEDGDTSREPPTVTGDAHGAICGS